MKTRQTYAVATAAVLLASTAVALLRASALASGAPQTQAAAQDANADAGTYFQSVPYRALHLNPEKTTLSLIQDGRERSLVFGKDFISYGDPERPDASVEAPIVFVGDGITAPGQNYDDYRGIDAKGKIVAFFYSAPDFESSRKAHYTAIEVKEAIAVAHGAVGYVSLGEPVEEQVYSFAQEVRDLAFPNLRWLDKQGRPNDHSPTPHPSRSFSSAATSIPSSGRAFPPSIPILD